MSRLVKRPAVDHTASAATLRSTPGKWMFLGEYQSSTGADYAAYCIRTAYAKGRLSAYRPAGSFEARTELTEFGADLWACYVGPVEGLRTRLPLDDPDRHALDTVADVAFARLVGPSGGTA